MIGIPDHSKAGGKYYKSPIQIIADAKNSLNDSSLTASKTKDRLNRSNHDEILSKINSNMTSLASMRVVGRLNQRSNPQQMDEGPEEETGANRNFVIRQTRKMSQDSRETKAADFKEDQIDETPKLHTQQAMMNSSNTSFKIKKSKVVLERKAKTSEEKARSVARTGTLVKGRTNTITSEQNIVMKKPRPQSSNVTGQLGSAALLQEEEKTSVKTDQVSEVGSLSNPTNIVNNIAITCATAIDVKINEEDKIGEGAYGTVHKALNRKTGAFIAVKIIKITGDLEKSTVDFKSLNREIDILQQLSHPHIVHYFGFKQDGDSISIYMELMSGGSIAHRLKQYGRLEEPVIRKFSLQILAGLQFLHSKGVIHRDLKGANILCDNYGSVKLADFGASHYIINQPLLNVSTSDICKSMKGSLYWMAPEVLNQRIHGRRVDIWSFGCTIIEMATGTHPWPSCETFTEFITMVNKQKTPPIPEHLSENAKDFLAKCLQFDPKKRPMAIDLINHPFMMEESTV